MFRIKRDVVLTFSGSSARLHLPSSGQTLEVDASTVQLLAAVCDRTGAQLQSLRNAFLSESIDEALSKLLAAGAISEPGAPPDVAESVIDALQPWGEPTWFLHLMTRDQPYARSAAERREVMAEIADTPSPPRFYCTCEDDGAAIVLPRPRVLPTLPLSTVLMSRRTCRRFAPDALDINALSDLLFYSAGYLFEWETDHLGTVLMKCAPAPGARHGIETYLVAQRCEGLAPGAYHYCVQHHALNSRGVVSATYLDDALHAQPWFNAAPVLFIYTYRTARLMWKYRDAAVYRAAHFEVGHSAQNLLLTGTALGLGVFSMSALAESVTEQALRIDPAKEMVMYVAGAGHQATGTNESARAGTDRIRLSGHLPLGTSPRAEVTPADWEV